MEKAKVLIIDDEFKFVDGLSRYLELLNYRVFKSATGEQGIDIIEREKPDIVLCDLKMPGIDGDEVIKRTKSISPKTIPIMITAYMNELTEERLTNMGAYTFIYKPIKIEEVEDILKKAIQDRGTIAEQR